MALKWDDLRLFLAVAEHGSLSAAARALRLGQPTLSRRMGELEVLVGDPLFARHKQGIELTETGQKLLPGAQRMAEWASEAELSISRQQQGPQGRVCIAALPGVAYEFVAPLSAQLRRKYPAIQLEVRSGIETLNLGRGEADLSLRTSRPSDPDLHCVDEVSGPMRVYTSKAYAAALPKTCGLADLDWICWAAPHQDQRVNRELEQRIANFKPAFTSDDFVVQLAACKAGVGAMVLARAQHRYSHLHELQELDIDLGAQAVGTLYLVCHKRYRYLPRVQLVIDAICEEFSYLRSAQTRA